MFSSKFGAGILKHPGYNDPVTALAGATIGSSLLGASASEDAASQQAQTAANAQAQQLAMFNTQNAQLAPQRATGYNALNQIGALGTGQYQQYDANGNPIGTATGSGYLTHQFNNQDLNAQLAPNYAFMLGQGQQATQNASNATGGLVGGNALKALQDYTQNYAGNAYQNAFTNYQTQRGNIYNTLASQAGLGQSAQNTSATLSGNTANALSSLATGSAAAQAAGTVGTANALTGGLTSLGNQNYLSSLLGQGGFAANSTILPVSMQNTSVPFTANWGNLPSE